jgi:hypothetical protein
MAPKKTPTRNETKEAAHKMAEALGRYVPEDIGFVLVTFELKGEQNLFTMTNAMPNLAAAAMRRAADVHEGKAEARKNPPKAKA